ADGTESQPVELERATRAGGIAHLSVVCRRISLGYRRVTVEIGRDISHRKQLEGHAVQGVKLEAVARLAGGIAHDFNNLLAAINCSCTLIAESLPAADARIRDIQAIEEAAARAAELTRQLLAFTRQQVLVPTVLDLNDVA